MQKKTDGKRKIFAIFGKKSKPVSRTFEHDRALNILVSLKNRIAQASGFVKRVTEKQNQ